MVAARVVVAEKPSVARDIAEVLGAGLRREGFLEGADVVVTWALGHLVTLAEPHQMNPAWKRWDRSLLPMLPAHWPLEVLDRTRSQFEIVRRLISAKGVREVICATDAGREGELIFRHIYEAAQCRAPVKRLWISSLTPAAIKGGLARLRPGQSMDGLADAAKGRSRADWLVGMNFSRAYTVASGELLSVGRVQTPTLAMVVERELAIRDFVPQPYHEVVATFAPEGAPRDVQYRGTWFRGEKGSDPEARRLPGDGVEARAIVERVRQGRAHVERLTRESKTLAPPLLYDLTELQRHANRLWGMSADATLKVAQALYETHKLLSYPRTDSRHLSNDVAATLPGIVDAIRAPYEAQLAPATGARPLSRRFVDDAKIGDHHAIIPTATSPQGKRLSHDEQRIYDLVCRRLLAAWHEDCVWAVTEVVTAVEGAGQDGPDRFRSVGTQLVKPGWKVLELGGAKAPAPERERRPGQKEQVDEEAVQTFPTGLAEGQVQEVRDVEALAKKTRPPPHLNEATLLTAMETAGRRLEDRELAEAMREGGLGTPATRAATIETLLQRGYLLREGKALRATDLGIALIRAVHPSVKSPELTGRWEARLSQLERGQEQLDTFLRDIEAYVIEVLGGVPDKVGLGTVPPTRPRPEGGGAAALTGGARSAASDEPRSAANDVPRSATSDGRRAAASDATKAAATDWTRAAASEESRSAARVGPRTAARDGRRSAVTDGTGLAAMVGTGAAAMVGTGLAASDWTGSAASDATGSAGSMGARSAASDGTPSPGGSGAMRTPAVLATTGRQRRPVGPEALGRLLHETFGHDRFRPHQEEVCRAVTTGADALLVMPTGAGKSLCYQLPGLARGGTTLVISPLIALIEDQVQKLRAVGLAAERIHSGRDRTESRAVSQAWAAGELDFLFIAPERLGVPGFVEWLARRPPSLIAVDEAHCISQWGHDFRPDYRQLQARLTPLRSAPVLALTATATPRVQEDIRRQLGLGGGGREARTFIHGFRRTNLGLEAVELGPSERPDAVVQLLSEPGARPAIVYAPTRDKAEAMAQQLGKRFRAAAYHAGLAAPVRERVQEAFLSGRLEVVVATVAFGMGVDKADVRTVVHLALPASLEGYYQEVGRAGRDGGPSRAVLLHSFVDRKVHESFLKRDYPELETVAKVFKALREAPQEPEELARRAHVPTEVVQKALEKLWNQGGAQVDADGLATRGRPGWEEGYATQRAFRQAQLEHVGRYAEAHGCRMLHLVRHFGDEVDGGTPCGLCDACAPGQTSGLVQERAPNADEHAVLSSILRVLEGGPCATGRLHREVCGADGMARREFEGLLGALTRVGLVALEDASFEKDGKTVAYQRALRTPRAMRFGEAVLAEVQIRAVEGAAGGSEPKKRGRTVRSRAGGTTTRVRKAKVPSRRAKATGASSGATAWSEAESTGASRAPKSAVRESPRTKSFAAAAADPGLAKELRAWRRDEAKRLGIPAFRIFSDKVLAELAARRPDSSDALLACHGVGPALVTRYGSTLLKLMGAG